MELTKEYLAENEDVIRRNFQNYRNGINSSVVLSRYQTIQHFIKNYAPSHRYVISIGSGGFEPWYLKTDYASDVHALAHELLMKKGWKGIFRVFSCDEIPFPDQFFNVAVCSEVIEHLPNKEIVRATFQELNRAAKHWIVTTPVKKVNEPTHKFVFSEKDLQELTAHINCFIERKGLYFYIHNGERKIY